MITFTGGMRGPRGANATWPFARLTIRTDGAVTVGLRGVRWLRGLRSVRYQPTDVIRAEEIRGGFLGSAGVRLVGREQSVVFWTREPERILDALGRAGVAIATTGEDKPPRVWTRP